MKQGMSGLFLIVLLGCFSTAHGVMFLKVQRTTNCSQPIKVGDFQWTIIDVCFQLDNSKSAIITRAGNAITYTPYSSSTDCSGMSDTPYNINLGDCNSDGNPVPWGGFVESVVDEATVNTTIAPFIYKPEYPTGDSNCVGQAFRVTSSLSNCIVNSGGTLIPQWRCDTALGQIGEKSCQGAENCAVPNTCTGAESNQKVIGGCSRLFAGFPRTGVRVGAHYASCLGGGGTVVPTRAPSAQPTSAGASSGPTQSPTTPTAPTAAPAPTAPTAATQTPTQTPTTQAPTPSDASVAFAGLSLLLLTLLLQ